jgi:transcriptional regulator with XRE-family HTH domain
MDMQPLRDSGLRQTELAELLGVSRQTIIKSFKNNRAPQRQGRSRLVTRLVAILQQLTARGVLPLAEETEQERRDRVVAKIRQVLHGETHA